MARLTRSVMRWVDERLARDADLRRRVERRMAELRLEEALLALRESRGLTQAQVAKLLGISQPAVAKLEAGARNVKLATLCRYAEALGAQLRVELVRRRAPRQHAVAAATR